MLARQVRNQASEDGAAAMNVTRTAAQPVNVGHSYAFVWTRWSYGILRGWRISGVRHYRRSEHAMGQHGRPDDWCTWRIYQGYAVSKRWRFGSH